MRSRSMASRREVRDHIYAQLHRVLSSAPVAYVKWDMNRSLSGVWSAALPPQRQGEVYHRCVLGVYEMLERLRTDFPEILVEGCCGGGGRFDGGMLYYTPQIWCSDNTDAMDRLRIQYGTSFCYPVCTMGAHVSVVPNEQNGRVTPLETRGIAAMSGAFGYELDLSKCTPEEKACIRRQIETYKARWELLQLGDYYRLTDPFREGPYAGRRTTRRRGSGSCPTSHTSPARWTGPCAAGRRCGPGPPAGRSPAPAGSGPWRGPVPGPGGPSRGGPGRGRCPR